MKQISVFTGSRDIHLEIPEKNFLYHALHPVIKQDAAEEEVIAHALDNPIDSKGLDAVPENASVVIIVDDVTRPTPAYKIIPFILQRLEKRTNKIKFVTAPGTHRRLSQNDLEYKIGKEIVQKYEIINVDYTLKNDYVYLADSEMGFPIYVNQHVLNADYKIVLGNIAPHNVVGWGGGAKMLMPGVCGEETVAQTHLKGVEFPVFEVFGNADCIMRHEIDKIGAQIGLDFLVNTVLDDQKNILGLFCGHYLHAHRRGIAFAQQALRPLIPDLADIVIVSAFPSNIDYWQGFKPLGFSLFGVKKGGTVIYLFDPKEGLCNNSPAHKAMLEKYLRSDKETVMRDLANGEISDIVGITNPLYHFQVLDHVKNVICVTNGLTAAECDLLSFMKADSINDAIETALRIQGPDAKIGVIPFGGETLVRLK